MKLHWNKGNGMKRSLLHLVFVTIVMAVSGVQAQESVQQPAGDTTVSEMPDSLPAGDTAGSESEQESSPLAEDTETEAGAPGDTVVESDTLAEESDTVGTSGDGLVKITSVPEGAVLIFDGKNVGTTPVELSEVEPGEHAVQLRKPGFFLKKARIRIPEGRTADYSFDLLAPACLVVESEPENATVIMKKKRIGTTPFSSCKLKPGTYEIAVALEGYGVVTRSVELAEERSDTIQVNLTPVEPPQKDEEEMDASTSRGEQPQHEAVEGQRSIRDQSVAVRLVVLSVFVLFGVGILIAELSGP